MPRVRPLRGLRYGPDQREALGALISPPSVGERPPRGASLDLLDPHNILRVVRGRGEDDAPYLPARDLLDHWRRTGILIRDPKAAIYRVDLSQGDVTLRSLLLLAHLEDPAAHPHEAIEREQRVTDIEAALNVCQVQISPVQVLASDVDGHVDQWMDSNPGEPLFEVWSGADLRCRVSAVFDDQAIQCFLHENLASAWVISDGHHRYEAIRRHRLHQRERAQLRPGDEHPIDYVMVQLIRTGEPGLAVEGADSPQAVYDQALSLGPGGAKATRFHPKCPKGLVAAPLERF